MKTLKELKQHLQLGTKVRLIYRPGPNQSDVGVVRTVIRNTKKNIIFQMATRRERTPDLAEQFVGAPQCEYPEFDWPSADLIKFTANGFEVWFPEDEIRRLPSVKALEYEFVTEE